MNFGGKRRKLLFLIVFLAYLLIGLLKFKVSTLVGCIIKFFIQQVAITHTFENIYIDKNWRYIKKVCWACIFNVYSSFINVDLLRSMHNGHLLDSECNSTSKKCLRLKFEQTYKEISKKYD